MKIKLKSILPLIIFVSIGTSSFAQNKKPVTPRPNANASQKAKVVTQKVIVNPTIPVSSSLRTAMDSLSYAIGINVGDNLKNQKLNVNADMIAKAISDVMNDRTRLLTTEAAGACIQNHFSKESGKVGGENKKKGDAFLAANKTKEGVKVTASGLQYKVLNEGAGPKPLPTEKVKVHYHGTLIDGTVFDSSVNRGEPAEFGVTQVISGWVEALQMMTVGSKWTLYIPSQLAYGAQGPGNIGPSQVLIFDVELLDIVK